MLEETRLLVVSENEDVLSTVSQTLSGHGYALEIVMNPKLVVERLSHEPTVSVVIADAETPYLSGIDLYVEMAIEEIATPFVLIAGSQELSRSELNETGIFDVVLRPIDESALRTVISQAVKLSQEMKIT